MNKPTEQPRAVTAGELDKVTGGVVIGGCFPPRPIPRPWPLPFPFPWPKLPPIFRF
jgi:hypothetical protein